MQIEEIKAGSRITGLDPTGPVHVVAFERRGEEAATIVYRDGTGRIRDCAGASTLQDRLHTGKNSDVANFWLRCHKRGKMSRSSNACQSPSSASSLLE